MDSFLQAPSVAAATVTPRPSRLESHNPVPHSMTAGTEYVLGVAAQIIYTLDGLAAMKVATFTEELEETAVAPAVEEI